jgi:hypothetical protein
MHIPDVGSGQASVSSPPRRWHVKIAKTVEQTNDDKKQERTSTRYP